VYEHFCKVLLNFANLSGETAMFRKWTSPLTLTQNNADAPLVFELQYILMQIYQ
jgi:hypothetical protein